MLPSTHIWHWSSSPLGQGFTTCKNWSADHCLEPFTLRSGTKPLQRITTGCVYFTQTWFSWHSICVKPVILKTWYRFQFWISHCPQNYTKASHERVPLVVKGTHQQQLGSETSPGSTQLKPQSPSHKQSSPVLQPLSAGWQLFLHEGPVFVLTQRATVVAEKDAWAVPYVGHVSIPQTLSFVFGGMRFTPTQRKNIITFSGAWRSYEDDECKQQNEHHVSVCPRQTGRHTKLVTAQDFDASVIWSRRSVRISEQGWWSGSESEEN